MIIALKVDTSYGLTQVTLLAIGCRTMATRVFCGQRAVMRASDEQRKRCHGPDR